MTALKLKTNKYVGPHLAQPLLPIGHIFFFFFYLGTLFLASMTPPSPDFSSTTLAVLSFPSFPDPEHSKHSQNFNCYLITDDSQKSTCPLQTSLSP